MNAFPFEVILPPLQSGVEQGSNAVCTGVYAGKVWTFVQIAIDTRQAQVFHIISSTVGLGNNVLDV